MSQTLREIQALLAAEGLAPHKRFGQNFLIDGNLLRKLATAAEPDATCTVLEIGPGTGALTGELVQRAGRVIAVEIDAGLVRVLERQFAGAANVVLIHADALASKHAIEPRVLEAIADACKALGGSFRVAANLPYNVGTPLMMELALLDHPPDRMCVTIQREVADRIAAEPGDDEYGPLSIVLRTAYDVHRIARVPPQAFWPAPNVESTMLRLDRLSGDDAAPVSLRRLADVVRAGFSHRRKTLRHNIDALRDENVIGRLPPALADLAAKRPEQVHPEVWRQLAVVLAED